MITEQMARMERETEKVQRDLKTVESRYGEDVLQLVIASGYQAGRCALRKEWIWRTGRGIGFTHCGS